MNKLKFYEYENMEDFFYQHCSSSVVRAWGEDAEDYLQSQWTIDITKIKNGDIRFGLRLTSKGKILAGAYIARIDDEEFLLISEKIPASEIITMMEENVVADEIEFSDESEKWSFLSFHFLDIDILESKFNVSAPKANRFLKTDNGRLWIDARMKNGFYLSLIQKNAVSKMSPIEGLQCITDERFETLRIKNENFSIPGEIGQEDLPQEASMEDYAVDFNKGCYLGQEVMARLHAMGQVQRQIMSIRWKGKNESTPTLPVGIMMDQKSVGSLRSLTKDENTYLGVAKIHLKAKDQLFENGLDLEGPEMGRVFSL
jgi:folate-binding protein YgfZ